MAKRKYRGKYPKRINTVMGSRDGMSVTVITNEGMRFIVKPITPEGRRHMPKLGEDIRALAATDNYSIIGGLM